MVVSWECDSDYKKAGIFRKSNVLNGYFLSIISRLQIRLDATPELCILMENAQSGVASSLTWSLEMRLKK